MAEPLLRVTTAPIPKGDGEVTLELQCGRREMERKSEADK
jgi:hypothetical protein